METNKSYFIQNETLRCMTEQVQTDHSGRYYSQVRHAAYHKVSRQTDYISSRISDEVYNQIDEQ